MDKKRLKKTAIEIARDLFLAFVVVLLIMLILYAYCGIWPPMVVVESGSMQHSDDRSFVGIIDTGDMVFVKEVNGREELKTYVEGEAEDYSRYGAFGDVVVYRPNGNPSRVPIIHRLVIWIEANDSAVTNASGGLDFDNYTFDVPSLEVYGSLDDVVIHNYGYEHEEVTISLQDILDNYARMNILPHDGYISMGDHNAPSHDQSSSGYEPILPDWIVGKAIGELPWFGLIKLSVTGNPSPSAVPRNSWMNLFVSVTLLVCTPLLIDFGWPILKRRLGWVKEEEEETGGEPTSPKEGYADDDTIKTERVELGERGEGDKPDFKPEATQEREEESAADANDASGEELSELNSNAVDAEEES